MESIGLDWNGSHCIILDWIEFESIGFEWNGLDWIRRDWIGWDWIGVEWSGVDWSGVEWSGVEWSGVEWSGVGVELERNDNIITISNLNRETTFKTYAKKQA